MRKSPTLKAELVLDAKATLGEGAIWNPTTQQLYWVDIEGKKLYIFDPANRYNREILLNQRIGTVVPTTTGQVVVALQNGIFLLDMESEQLTFITNPEENVAGMRFNDGKCDPAGRLWVGSMGLEEEQGKGSLYRINNNGDTKKMVAAVTISNGIIWSSDHTTMYYIDTPTYEVRAFDYNNETGEIRSPRIIITILASLGFPDGMTIDEEGMLWIAIWNGGIVGRWNPETGELLQTIQLPAHNITSCAFGNENLDVLYITTARKGLTDAQKEKYPLSGGLFAVNPGVKGVPADFYVE